MVEVAVIGFGTVGSGVVEILDKNQKQIERAVPGGVHVKYIVDIREFPGNPYESLVVHDIQQVLDDPDIRIVCETMGGKEPARTFSQMALEKGISVVTSNKELVEAHGPELIKVAQEHQCSYLFEASVGGGIPLLRPIKDALVQEDITQVLGILNGTTNYILTKMELEGAEYADALREAQALGYAERNPEADVEGHDTARKIAILASLLSGKRVKYGSFYVEGISRITTKDFLHARANGYAIRLLGLLRQEEDLSMTLMTAPFLVKQGHPLHGVDDVFNGVVVHGNMVDDVMFYGRGAGKLPTGSAVVADVIHAANSIGRTIPMGWTTEQLMPRDHALHQCRFLVRAAKEKEQEVREVFGSHVALVCDREELPEDFAFFTDVMTEAAFEECAGKAEILSRVRVLDE